MNFSAVPHLRRNIGLFIAFRIFFNARFYYPVLAILFLDLGLSLEQYAMLNVVWAVTIILMEIPSGALADVVGRKTMVLIAAGLMVVEMVVLALAPIGLYLFPILCLNRVVSGAAEACASGADEALAYDSLEPSSREEMWPRVLARLMRYSSAMFIFVMILGALAYDAVFLNDAAQSVGYASHLIPSDTVRWPIWMTLVMSLGAVACAAAMREPPREATAFDLRRVVQNITQAAVFVFSTRKIFFLLMAGVLLDSFVRLFLTFGSNYYRLIEIPPFLYGILGSGSAVLGFLAAIVARRLNTKAPPVAIFFILAGLVFIGLVATGFAVPRWGVLVVVPLGLAMPMAGFFLSTYLNAWTGSELRATVLSFRGVVMNIGYGMAGLAFAAVTSGLRSADLSAHEDVLFARSLISLPFAFILCMLVLILWYLKTRPRHSTGQRGLI